MAQTRHLNHAVIILFIVVTTVFCQDHQMLIENCNWQRSSMVLPGTTLRVTPIVDHNLVSNLTCQTQIYLPAYSVRSSYDLKVRVNKFDLLGPDDCKPESEMMVLQFANIVGGKNISWCGKKYAKEVKLPVSSVNLLYYTGASGEGSGFELEFSAVTPTTCYGQSSLLVTKQPMLLYSPNYPGTYKSYLDCSVKLIAEAGQYIRIKSLFMDIERSYNCRYDAITINNVKYCGNDQIDIVVNSSMVEINFSSDSGTEFTGYILEYVAFSADILNCNETSTKFRVPVTVEQSIIDIKYQVPHDSRRSNDSIMCQVTLVYAHSDDKVLDVLFTSEVLYSDSYIQKVSEEQKSDQVETSPVVRFLHTEDRQKTFSVNLTQEGLMFIVQAVDKESLPESMKARPSLLWVNGNVSREIRIFRMLPTTDDSLEKNIEIRVYRPLSAGMSESNLFRSTVSDYIEVYNGPDSSYFELTRACDGNLRKEKSITSINSQNLAVVIKRSPTFTGFWLYFGPCTGFIPPSTELISMSGSFDSGSLRMKNLFCTWKLYPGPHNSWANTDLMIRMKAENNFAPHVANNYFTVAELQTVVGGDSIFKSPKVIMEYTKNTKQNIWLYSSVPTFINVSIFNVEANEKPIYFGLSYDVIQNSAIQDTGCVRSQYFQANKTVQFATTRNYPNFFRNTACEWIIQRDLFSDWDSTIFIEFPDVSDFPCTDYSFKIWTSDKGGSFIPAESFCDVNSFQKKFYEDTVKISLFAGSNSVVPGFRFVYYTEEVASYSNCNTNVTLSNADRFLMRAIFPSSERSNILCSYYIYPVTFSSTITLYMNSIKLSSKSYNACSNDAIEIYVQDVEDDSQDGWKLASRLCGLEDELSSYTFTQTSLYIAIHYKAGTLPFSAGYEMEAVMYESYCMDASLLATYVDGYLASPNYPKQYPNKTVCMWHISTNSESSVVVVDLLDFEMEDEYNFQCSRDSVEIYDGPSTASAQLKVLCGRVSYGHYRSTGNSMTVVFRSDWVNSYRGFRFKFRKEDGNHYSGGGLGDATVIIIVTVVGGAFCILLIVGVTVFILRRNKHRRNPRSRARVPASRTGQSRTRANRGNNSVYIVDPGIVNAGMTPPSYSEVMQNYHHSAALPPYSRSEFGTDHALPAYTPRCSDSDYESLDPPPYSADMPGGPTQWKPYMEVNIPRPGSSSDSPDDEASASATSVTSLSASLGSNNTDGLERNTDGDYSEIVFPDASASNDAGNEMNAASSPPVTLHPSFQSLAEGPGHLDSGSQLDEAPPAYESEVRLQNERRVRQNSRQTPSQAQNGRLGSL